MLILAAQDGGKGVGNQIVKQVVIAGLKEIWWFGGFDETEYAEMAALAAMTAPAGQLDWEVTAGGGYVDLNTGEAGGRGTPNVPFLYPIEDDRVDNQFLAYPYEVVDDRRDPLKKKTLIFLHGYNVDESSAEVFFTTTFKRTYWQGFRGNFVGFSWRGNEYDAGPFTFYKPNQTNAFQTAPALWMFLRNTATEQLPGGGWGLDPADIDVMAHSLGNQVMWEAMRINAWKTTEKLFNNAISVEAAIWSEAFLPLAELDYAPPDDPVFGGPYTPDELKRMSWRGWYNQPGHDPRSSLTGKVFHSFKADDSVLMYWMRVSDMLAGSSHYNRDRTAAYRSPSHLAWVPALMAPGKRTVSYSYENLMVPIGAGINVMADFNFDAAGTGWQDGEHSEFKDRDYIDIYQWYHRFLATPMTTDGQPSATGPTAIPIGRE